jgi:hypothetical protein
MGSLDFSRRCDHRFGHYVRLFERHKVRLVNHAIKCMPGAVRTRRGPPRQPRDPGPLLRNRQIIFWPTTPRTK